MKLHNMWWCGVHGSKWVQANVLEPLTIPRCPQCKREMRRLRSIELAPIKKRKN